MCLKLCFCLVNIPKVNDQSLDFFRQITANQAEFLLLNTIPIIANQIKGNSDEAFTLSWIFAFNLHYKVQVEWHLSFTYGKF